MFNRKLSKWVKAAGPARAAVLLFSTGLLAVGADAAIAHFAGRDMKSAFQLVPVVASPIAFAVLAALGLGHWPEGLFRKCVRIVAVAVAAVGLAGTAFHVSAFLRLLEGQALSMRSLELALAVAPPLGAPGAFIAVGGLLWLLASPRLTVELHSRANAPAFN